MSGKEWAVGVMDVDPRVVVGPGLGRSGVGVTESVWSGEEE